jgi:hypothetical protein
VRIGRFKLRKIRASHVTESKASRETQGNQSPPKNIGTTIAECEVGAMERQREWPMTLEEVDARGRREKLSTHILGASVVMIGVSTTLIGLVKVAKAHMGATHVDQYAGVAALFFLLSAGASYLSIRVGNRTGLGQRCENTADLLFVIGLVGISAISIFFAYEVI